MLAEYKRNTNIGVGIGFILQLAGRVMLAKGMPLGIVFGITGLALFIWGCVSYARGKGHSGWLGLLGLLSLLGLIVLAVMPDKNK